ncbi:MAG: hypothetical protein KGL39_00825 [Patescibacteria group bacterium]|nr:hypothetical protein [Patescibacteria group bacterium]
MRKKTNKSKPPDITGYYLLLRQNDDRPAFAEDPENPRNRTVLVFSSTAKLNVFQLNLYMQNDDLSGETFRQHKIVDGSGFLKHLSRNTNYGIGIDPTMDGDAINIEHSWRQYE